MSPAAAAMLEKVQRTRNVSFPELQQAYEGVVGEGSSKGKLTMERPRNMIWWAGMSDGFIDAMEELQPFIAPDACSWLVYLADGIVPAFPLAKRPPKAGYRKPHWCPMVFNPR